MLVEMVSTRRTTSTPPPQPHSNTRRIPKTPFSTPKTISASLKSVLLDDWWLVKAQGNALAVEGFAKSQRPAIRTFSSAAISKRHTATILETTDGIVVTLSGFLNISRTTENGFPPEVCNRYMLGFPFDWEEHAAGLLGSTDESASARNPSSQFNMSLEDSESNPLPFSIADIPVTATRDFIMSCVGDSEQMQTIFEDILRTSRDNGFGDTTMQINSHMEDNHPIESVKSPRIETQTKSQIDDDKAKSADICFKDSQKSKGTRSQPSKKSIPRRSSARLKNLK